MSGPFTLRRTAGLAALLAGSIEGTGGEALIQFATAYNIEGGGFDELQVGIVAEGADFQPLQTYGGVSTGYPDFLMIEVSFREPAGPYQIQFLLYADEICSGAVGDGGAALCGGDYQVVAVDDVTLLR